MWKGCPVLLAPCLSLGSSHFVLLILQPAQEESKDKVEMLEEGEGMGERHIPFLHLPVSLVVWRIPWSHTGLKPEHLDKYCVPGTVSSLCPGL